MEMTQEWIDQFNKKCAEFLGSELKNDGQFDYWTYDHLGFDPIKIRGSSWISGNFEFHSDWNWIMEVCFKISSLSSDDTFEGLNGRVFRFKHSMFWEVIEDKNKFLLKIEEFIDWYNKQKE